MAKNYDELNPDANVKVGIPEKVGRGLRSAAIETGTGLANSARGWGILGNAAIVQPAKGFARGLAGSPTAPSQTPPSAPRTSAQRASIPQVPVPTNSSELPVFNGSGQPVYVSSMTAQPAAQLPQGRAMTDAPAAIPLTDRAMTDVNPALAAAPRARTVVPQRAILDVNAALEAQPALPVGRDVYGNVQYTPAMTSPAALRLQQRMNATNEARSLGFQPGSARAMQLQSQWDEAARAAFTGAMTPQQQAAYEREQAAERMRQGAAFRETPQYQMGEQGIRRDVGVADAQARGLIGASATRAEQERLNRETELARTNRTESGADARARLLNEREMEQTRMTTKTQKEVAQGKEPTDADRLDKFLNEAVGKGAVAADLPALADEWRKIHGVQSAPPAAGGFSPQALALKADAEKRFPNNVNAQKDYVRRQLAQQNAR